jgi:hypothetical protein
LDGGLFIRRRGNRRILVEEGADGLNQLGNKPVDEGGAGFDPGHQLDLLAVKVGRR